VNVMHATASTKELQRYTKTVAVRFRVSGRQTRLQFGFPSRTERQQGNWPRPTASLSEKIAGLIQGSASAIGGVWSLLAARGFDGSAALIRIAGKLLPTGATRERPQVMRRPLPFFFRRHV
jgi:hypothetical protein